MTVTTHVPQDNPRAMDGAHVQLKDGPVMYDGRTKPIASGPCPCVRPGMLIQDRDRAIYGIATLCTENAVTYQTEDGKTYTVGYDCVGLDAAGPETSVASSLDEVTPPTDKLEPRGEVNHDFECIGGFDARLGVRVPVGTLVFFGDDQHGIVIGGTVQLAIIRDEQGREQAETWGTIMVQASGPSFDVHATGGATATPATAQAPTDLMAITPAEFDAITDDPYRTAALRALDLMTYVDRIQEDVKSLDRDRLAAGELLNQIKMTLANIADNRTRRILCGVEGEATQ